MLKDEPTPPFDLLLKDHDPAAGVNACRMLAKLKNTAWATLPVVGAPACRHRDLRGCWTLREAALVAIHADVVRWLCSLQRP